MNEAAIPVVETERLLLRGPRKRDSTAWAGFIEADPDFLKYVPIRKGRPAQERADLLMASHLGRWDESPLAMGWSVVVKDEDVFVGVAGVDALNETDGEIEYYFARPYWGRGYASEVARAVTDYWFANTDGSRLVAWVVPENVGSVRAVEKCGYTYVRAVNYLELMGNPPGVVFETPMTDEYELTREQWRSQQ
jgi:RimJ/RimL family protein N-acetyltransferase